MDLIPWVSQAFDALDPTSAVAGGIGVPSLAFLAWRAAGKIVDAVAHRQKVSADTELEDAKRESTGVHGLVEARGDLAKLVTRLLDDQTKDREKLVELEKRLNTADAATVNAQSTARAAAEQLERQTELNGRLAGQLSETTALAKRLNYENAGQATEMGKMRDSIAALEQQLNEYRQRAVLAEAALALLPPDLRRRLEHEAKLLGAPAHRVPSSPPPPTNFAHPRPRKETP